MPCEDDLLPHGIRRRLETLWLGRRIYYLREVDSTNRFAADLARAGEPHGTLVVSDYQTGGRGRWDRTWESPAGKNVLFSLILRPEVETYAILPVTLVFSVAVAETLTAITGREASVKWPNDVLVEGKKICGILSEGVSKGGVAVFVVVGMGVNVNMGSEDFSEEIRGRSCSCSSLTGLTWDRAEVLARLLSALERGYDEFAREGFGKIAPRYKSKLSVLGKTVRFVKSGAETVGRVLDVGTDGSLIVETANGRMALREQEVSLHSDGGESDDPRC
jgi:BirA family biotin operon repressor/biotin-[acetyl-CoA-carboxylase] ligase